jgi:Hint domain
VVSIGGSTTSGTLGQPGEHDWLAVTLAAGQAYEFTITGLSDLAFPIVGTAAALDEGIVSDQVTDVFPGTATPENRNVWFTPDTTGTYYVDISDPATIGGYSVSAVAVPNDFPDNTSTAGVVTVGGSATSGTLGEKGEHDWLAVTLSQGQAYEFTVTGFSNYGFVMVGTAAALDEGVVAVATGNIPPATVTPQTQQVWFTPDTTGTYYVDVSDAATIGGYSVSAIAVPNDFPNNTSTTGVVTPGGTVASGTLGEPGEHDWFAVTLAGGQAYEFTVTGLSNLAQTRVGAAAALDEGVVADEVFEVPAGIATPQTQNIWFTPDTSGTYYVDISDPATIGAYGVSVVPVSNDFPDNTSTTGVVNVVCFTQGTRIATPDGEVPVEDLSVGDLVLAQFAGLTQIKWIGHRTIDCRRHPRPREVWPVRVRAQAFSPSQPHRDLLLSPDHAVFVDGMLIPVRQLINHTTIAQEPATLVTYYHVELARHDVLNAEGLPAESYLDTGNRAFFGKSDEPLVLHPDLTDEADYPAREAGSCAPFVRDEANVRPVWQRVSERAAAIGRPELPRATTTDADLRLLADRCPVNPVFSDSDRVIFVLPRSAKEVRLLSRAQSPTEARPWLDDRRKLGVRVKRIVLRGADELREIPVDHPDLTWGWWAVERDGQIMSRWTDGEAVLPLPTMSGHVMLELHLAGSMIYVEEAAPARGTELVAAA